MLPQGSVGSHASSGAGMGVAPDEVWEGFIFQVTWIVARKFQFQVFTYTDKSGTGTVKVEDAEACVPSTAFVAADHLTQLIVFDAMARDAGRSVGGRADFSGSGEPPAAQFGRAVWRVHASIFAPYITWAKHQRLPAWPEADLSSMWGQPLHENVCITAGLLDLAMYFCLWTEGANLRHMPEALWFLFWAMRNSKNYLQLKEAVLAPHNLALVTLPYDPKASERHMPRLVTMKRTRIVLRNFYLAGIQKARLNAKGKNTSLPVNLTREQQPDNIFDNVTTGEPRRCPQTNQRLQELTSAAMALLREKRPKDPSNSLGDESLMAIVLTDLIYFCDGGEFLEHIVTPIFQALAFEISQKGGAGIEPSLRITYDDANESFTLPSNVRRIMEELHISISGIAAEKKNPGMYEQSAMALFGKLWHFGAVDPYNMMKRYAGVLSHDTEVEDRHGFLVKTFQERRTWFTLFRAYFRVLSFHCLWFHVLLGLAFALNPAVITDPVTGEVTEKVPVTDGTGLQDPRWLPVSSAVLTHAVLEVCYAFGGLYTSWTVPPPPAADRKSRQRVSLSTGVIGFLQAFFCCCAPRRMKEYIGLAGIRELTEREREHSPEKSFWSVHRVKTRSKIVSSILYGLLFIVAVLALFTLFIGQFNFFPWPASVDYIRGTFVDLWPWVAIIYSACVLGWFVITLGPGYTRTDQTVKDFLSSCWTGVIGCCGLEGSSASRALEGGEFLASEPRTGLGQLLRNMLFWAIVLGLKFLLDYFFILRTVPSPIRGLLQENWLGRYGTCDSAPATPAPTAADASAADAVRRLLADDNQIGDTGLACLENWLLVGALMVPLFLVVLFNTGILYQVGVFIYGCVNGLLNLRLGQVVTWNDLIKQFDNGVKSFSERILTKPAQKTWQAPETITHYYSRLSEQSEKAPDVTAEYSKALHNLPSIGNLDQQDLSDYGVWTPFADIWDTIIQDLRLADLISTREERNLKFQTIHFLRKPPYNLKPLVLPVCFFAGKIQQTMDNGTKEQLGSQVLADGFRYMLVLVTELGLVSDEVYDKFIDLEIVNQPQNYYHAQVRANMVKAVKAFILAVDALRSKDKKENPKYDAAEKDVLDAFVDLANQLLVEIKYAQKLLFFDDKRHHRLKQQFVMLNSILNGELGSLRMQRSHDNRGIVLRKYSVAPGSKLERNLGALGGKEEFIRRIENIFLQDVGRLLAVLKAAISLTDNEAQPANEEALRVLKFFISTLFNNQMKSPRPVNKMMSLTTLVPHYAEGVIYPLDADEVSARTGVPVKAGEMASELLMASMEGFDISTLRFLRIQFPDEWKNFVERMLETYPDAANPLNPDEVTENDFLLKPQGAKNNFSLHQDGLFSKNENARMDLMRWASNRGQLLSRTVKGMMQYEDALLKLEALENVMDGDMLAQARNVRRKFMHIVSSQVYGSKKRSKKPQDKWLAYSIDYLMEQYPSFRVAYIDEDKGGPGKNPFSVLMRWNAEEKKVEELYRVRLPSQTEDKRGVILGEGKPENQNHAIIFCFGEALQTVDMNQENRLAEAFKMRNLLNEFDPARPEALQDTHYNNASAYHSEILRQARSQPLVALVGFREWIFSGKAGALGLFAAGAEFAFGTIVQRTMAEPGGARFHYGHPDVWNKLFTMTRGGVSKATRAFHISEDVFGGYNAIARGAVIKYREYVSVGKARDVGFEQINGFESKVAGGNGEQSISRDVFRLGTSLDWFRLMSWYHSGIGFFVNSALTMTSVYLAVWLIFLFMVANALTVQNQGTPVDDSTLIGTVNTVQVFQLGLLSIIPYWGELALEQGVLEGSMIILRQMISGSILFFIFKQQTSAHYFTQVASYGGATYVATGRGFALTHSTYVKLFTSFGRSHMYLGLQLGLMALMLAALSGFSPNYKLNNYYLSTWGTWLVSVSLFFAPFWFTPSSFKFDVVNDDFNEWRRWMTGSMDSTTKQSWVVYHRGNLAKARNLGGKQTDHYWNQFLGIIFQLFNAVILLGVLNAVLQPQTPEDGDVEDASWLPQLIGFAFFELVIFAIIFIAMFANSVQALNATWRRVTSIMIAGIFLALIIYFSIRWGGSNSTVGGVSAILLLLYANYTAAIIIVQLALYAFPYHDYAMALVDAGYYAADTACGLIAFAWLFVLSILPFMDTLQALLLFNYELLKEARTGQTLRDIDKRTGKAGRVGGATGGDSPGHPSSPAAGPAGAVRGNDGPPPDYVPQRTQYETLGAQKTYFAQVGNVVASAGSLFRGANGGRPSVPGGPGSPLSTIPMNFSEDAPMGARDASAVRRSSRRQAGSVQGDAYVPGSI